MGEATTLEEIGEETALAKPMTGIKGLVGLTTDDLDMPYVYLVREGSKHALLKNGKKAEAGSYYHSAKKEAKTDLEVIVAVAVKGEGKKGGEGEGSEDMVTVWRTIMLPLDNMTSPFSMSFKGMNLWYGWKPLMNLLVAEQIDNLPGKVLKLGFRMATTKTGNSYEVPEISIVRDATKEELATAESAASRFSVEG